jgi:N-methylhydantoinase B
MGEAMLRTAYSQILNSSRDFSTAICDDQARLVAQPSTCRSTWAPSRGGGLGPDAFSGRVHPGDVFLLNDPYTATTTCRT